MGTLKGVPLRGLEGVGLRDTSCITDNKENTIIPTVWGIKKVVQDKGSIWVLGVYCMARVDSRSPFSPTERILCNIQKI